MFMCAYASLERHVLDNVQSVQQHPHGVALDDCVMHLCHLLDIPEHPLLLVANRIAPCICMQSCMHWQERLEQSVLLDHAT